MHRRLVGGWKGCTCPGWAGSDPVPAPALAQGPTTSFSPSLGTRGDWRRGSYPVIGEATGTGPERGQLRRAGGAGVPGTPSPLGGLAFGEGPWPDLATAQRSGPAGGRGQRAAGLLEAPGSRGVPTPPPSWASGGIWSAPRLPHFLRCRTRSSRKREVRGLLPQSETVTRGLAAAGGARGRPPRDGGPQASGLVSLDCSIPVRQRGPSQRRSGRFLPEFRNSVVCPTP